MDVLIYFVILIVTVIVFFATVFVGLLMGIATARIIKNKHDKKYGETVRIHQSTELICTEDKEYKLEVTFKEDGGCYLRKTVSEIDKTHKEIEI